MISQVKKFLWELELRLVGVKSTGFKPVEKVLILETNIDFNKEMNLFVELGFDDIKSVAKLC